MKKRNTRKERNIIPILGINVTSTSTSSVLTEAEFVVRSGGKKVIVTPNPEIIIKADRDQALKTALNRAWLAIPDGVGVCLAAKYLSLPSRRNSAVGVLRLFLDGLRVGLSLFLDKKSAFGVLQTVPGRVVFRRLVDEASREGWRVFLLGSTQEVVALLISKLKAKRPVSPASPNRGELVGGSKLEIQGESGPRLTDAGKPVNNNELGVERGAIERINKFKPDILFVAFGPGKQEKWLERNLPLLKIKIGMVVGGAFDYYAGKYPLPPDFVEELGLEWLWRLTTQPWRIKRVWTAVVVFPWRVFRYKLHNL